MRLVTTRRGTATNVIEIDEDITFIRHGPGALRCCMAGRTLSGWSTILGRTTENYARRPALRSRPYGRVTARAFSYLRIPRERNRIARNARAYSGLQRR